MFREIRTSEKMTEMDMQRNIAIERLNEDIRRLLDRRIDDQTKELWADIDRRRKELGLI